MKKTLGSFIAILLIVSFLPRFSHAGEPGVLIVKISDPAKLSELESNGDEVENLFENLYRVKVADIPSAIERLQSLEWIEFAEKDVRIQTQLNADDPLYVLDELELNKQWYLPKIQIHKAWDVTRGSGITVAVVDTGINARHEDLNDGRVVRGYATYCQVPSTVASDCLVRLTGELSAGVNSDDNGHGTIVAGIIGAIPDNKKGISGINWNVKLMPIKALDATGSGLASDVASGIKWAADNGAKIINLSIGGPGLEGLAVLAEAIKYAYDKGVLIVSAAGNDAAITGGNLNTNPILPVCADGGENRVVGVAAVDYKDLKARFSNFGSNCIDIAAPGVGTFIDREQKQGLVSTYYDPTRPGELDLYVYAVGTSLSAPIVSGVAALIMSAFPDLDVRAIRDKLIASVDNIDQGNQTGCNGGSCVGQIGKGRVNAFKAVTGSASIISGSLVRTPEGQNFLIERGLKLPVSDFVLAQRFAGSPQTMTSGSQLQSFPTGLPVPPADGTLIKETSSPTVYLVEGNKRRPLSYLAFISRGHKFEQVISLPTPEVVSYELGAEAPYIDGLLLKTPDSPAVFIVEGDRRKLLSFFVFQQRGYHDRLIGIVSDIDLARYPLDPSGYLYSPLDGTLIKGDGSATVYVIQNRERRGLNFLAFSNRGYKFEDVKHLSQGEVNAYPLGSEILN